MRRVEPTGKTCKPANNGRYSNGPLWAEYLSGELGLPYNPANSFAVSGSRTSDLLPQIAGVTPSPHCKQPCSASYRAATIFWTTWGWAGLGQNDAGWGLVITNAVANITPASRPFTPA
ncbi:MAG TPA: hypothetical protein VG167_05905 [Verrucomicrobiae bacterium]|nr:hypothetical protein [Verrucomicrobiae bacterium]